MGTREQAADRDFSGIPLDEEVEASLKETAVISMGTEISEMDLENIVALCDQVFSSNKPIYELHCTQHCWVAMAER